MQPKFCLEPVKWEKLRFSGGRGGGGVKFILIFVAGVYFFCCCCWGFIGKCFNQTMISIKSIGRQNQPRNITILFLAPKKNAYALIHLFFVIVVVVALCFNSFIIYFLLKSLSSSSSSLFFSILSPFFSKVKSVFQIRTHTLKI